MHCRRMRRMERLPLDVLLLRWRPARFRWRGNGGTGGRDGVGHQCAVGATSPFLTFFASVACFTMSFSDP